MKTFIQISIIVLLQFVCIEQFAFSQDSVHLEKHVKHKFVPSSVKATMLAAALPGLGQVYNRKYWKIPLVYAGFGGMMYAAKQNSSNFRLYMKAFNDLTDENPETASYLKLKNAQTIDPAMFDEIKNPQSYSHYKDELDRLTKYYKQYRDLSFIGLGAWYIVTILDANVDASLFNYDVSENLDVSVMPIRFEQPGGYIVAGINVSLMFNF
ncbi:MAG TPA: DUF5683 domain-containing protein [Bacteroidales bacterium]|nr:DUF5683 domain-containing protein [Bacteroidales bacterium]